MFSPQSRQLRSVIPLLCQPDLGVQADPLSANGVQMLVVSELKTLTGDLREFFGGPRYLLEQRQPCLGRIRQIQLRVGQIEVRDTDFAEAHRPTFVLRGDDLKKLFKDLNALRF